MPHQITWEKQGVFWRVHGDVSAQEILDAGDDMYHDPLFNSLRYFIWDATNVQTLCISNIEIDIQAVKDIGQSIHKEALKCAFIATDNVIRKQIEQYINRSKSLHSTWEFGLFECIEEVREWAC